jgi:7-carboxy-7-deazaguanine synthase
MIGLNQQKPESRAYYTDGSLDIVGEPWYTIQGEGPFAGRPAVFVRLAGCNLQCPACDTDYTSNRVNPGQLVVDCFNASGEAPCNLFVITGGEPFRQNLGLLVCELLHRGAEVQIETNGTLLPDEGFPLASNNLTIVCSPKSPLIHNGLKRWIKALKYVLDADNVADDGLPFTTLGNSMAVARPWPGFTGEVYVQPAYPSEEEHLKYVQDPHRGELNPKHRNEKAAVASCMKHGYRLSLQMHKIVGLK